jgi:hypothetical protein
MDAENVMDDQELGDEGQEEQPATFPGIRVNGIEDTMPDFVNFISVNFDVYTFHLVFSLFTAPIFQNDEDRTRFQQDGWSADVMARLLVPPAALRDMVRYIYHEMKGYDAQFGTDFAREVADTFRSDWDTEQTDEIE